MQIAVKLPTQIDVLHHLVARLEEKRMELYRLSGMAAEYGHAIACESEIRELLDELASILAQPTWRYMNARESGAAKAVGRPQDELGRDIAPLLLALFCRFNDKAGRQSVWTSTDGKLCRKRPESTSSFLESSPNA